MLTIRELFTIPILTRLTEHFDRRHYFSAGKKFNKHSSQFLVKICYLDSLPALPLSFALVLEVMPLVRLARLEQPKS